MYVIIINSYYIKTLLRNIFYKIELPMGSSILYRGERKMIKCYKVVKKHSIFLPGDIIKVSYGKYVYGDMVLCLFRSGYEVRRYKGHLKEKNIIGKVTSLIRDM